MEIDELFDLLKDESNFRLIEDDLETLWQDTEGSPSQQSVGRYEKFKNRVDTQPPNHYVPSGKTNYYKWAVAACFIFVISFAGYYFYINQNLHLNQPLSQNIAQNKLNPAVKKIILSDGSVVILNKGGHLNYPQKFTGKSREVYLSGEAYFDIKHDSNKVFLVHTGNLVTRVLGTAFNIKSGKDQNLIEVTVTRGKVAVSNPKQTLAVLLPNQKISYNVRSGQYQQQQTNANASILWKEEDLVIDNLTTADAVKKIEERYATNIIFGSDKIKQCKFTAYFLNTTDLEQVIKVICKLNQLSYTVNDRGVYTLSGNGCQ